MSNTTTFSFIPVEIHVLDICGPVSASVSKENLLLNKHFHNTLRLADVTSIFIKKDKNYVENYGPVRFLLTDSNIFERIMQKQINNYISNFLSLHLVDIEKEEHTIRTADSFRKMENMLRQ